MEWSEAEWKARPPPDCWIYYSDEFAYCINSMDPVTLVLAKSAGKLLLTLTKEGLSRLLKEPLLLKAATDTQLEFERIEIRDSLVKWSQSEDVAEILEELSEGIRQDVGSLVPSFIGRTGFSAGNETGSVARAILESFLKHLVNEMLASADGLIVLANRQEVIYRETQNHITNEATRVVERVDAIGLFPSLNCRTYPLQQLTISNFAGVRGEATVTFKALTLILGTMKLSHSMSDLLRIFSDREHFERTSQPTDASSSEFSRIPVTDETALVITVNHPLRMFTKRGTLRLTHANGQQFIVTIERSGAMLSVGNTPVPVFFPVIKTISPGKLLVSYSDLEKGHVEGKLASHFGITTEELKACIDGVPTDTSVFGYDYSFGPTLNVRRPSEPRYQTIPSLSGGEQSRLLLDLAVRISTYAANIQPIVLLIDQAKFFLDPKGWGRLFEWLEKKEPPFQTVVDVHLAPSFGNLQRAACYEVKGEDMEVSAFEPKTWESFKR